MANMLTVHHRPSNVMFQERNTKNLWSPFGEEGKSKDKKSFSTSVCVVGQMRTFHSSKLVEQLQWQIKDLNADIFLVLSEDKELQSHLLDASVKNITQGFAALSTEEIVSRLKPKGVHWYTGEEFKLEKRIDCLNEHEEEQFQERRYWDWQATFWPLQHCVGLIQDEETKKGWGFKYDHVVRLRPDMALSQPLQWKQFPELAQTSKPYVAVSQFTYLGCIFCDHWAFMTRPAADVYFKVHNAYQTCNRLAFDPVGDISCGATATCDIAVPASQHPKTLECFWLRYMTSEGVKVDRLDGPQTELLSFADAGGGCQTWGPNSQDHPFGCWDGQKEVAIVSRGTCGR